MALHLYSIACVVSREKKVSDLITVPSPNTSSLPSLKPPSVTIRFPLPSYQSTEGVLMRCCDLIAVHVRMIAEPSTGPGVFDDVVMLTESALSGSTETYTYHSKG